ncbi:MAG TPA: ETC complex I subunit [Aliiroseovarius sp.]|nr:ETC complex I subunit [Aliiroseovarius sp.]
MSARIYQPARNAMTSGKAKTHDWVLEFAPEEARMLDPLMGWTASGDTQSQVRMSFPTREAALAFAERHGIVAEVHAPHERKANIRKGGSGENFMPDRRQTWTH